MENRMKVCLTAGLLAAFVVLCGVCIGWAQTGGAPGATISGTVTADRDYALSEASGKHIPALYAVRVRARDIDRHIVYTVFTNKAHYHIYNLPPGNYQMSALQDGFDSTMPTVVLKAGETKTADVALKVRPDHLRAELVDFDTLFPPSPTRDYLMQHCAGCHGLEHIPWQRMGGRDEDAWATAVGRMFDLDGTNNHTLVPQVNPAAIPESKRQDIIDYFSKIFPVDGKPRDLKLADLPLDEEALSKTLDIEYEMPPPQPGKTTSNHDVWPSSITPTVYMSEMGNDAVLAMDTTRIDFPGRWRTYLLPNPDLGKRVLGPHGITQTPDGLVWAAEIDDSMIAEVDPETGKVTQFPTPIRGTPHTIAYDSKGNLWFTMMQGKSMIGKLDRKTNKITEYDPSPSDANAHYYGLNVDQKDRVWAAGMTSHKVVGYDPKTNKWTAYASPTQPSGVRRVTIDSKGMVWFSEHIGQHLGMLNPNTGKITEYKDPYPYFGGYAVMADHDDNIWVTLRSYGVIAKFDQKSKKYTYYPEPFPDIMGREHPGSHGTALGGLYPPRIEQAPNGTIWYSGIGMHYLVAFEPNGNVPKGKASGN